MKTSHAPNPFWIVWRIGSGDVTVRHSEYRDAKAEAKRLAVAHPGNEFAVCCGVMSFKRDDLIEKHYNFEAAPQAVMDEEIPF